MPPHRRLAGRLCEAQRFESAAQRAGARYVEVALIVDPAEQLSRFRGEAGLSEIDAAIRRALASAS